LAPICSGEKCPFKSTRLSASAISSDASVFILPC
jgi:hypothetical protein